MSWRDISDRLRGKPAKSFTQEGLHYEYSEERNAYTLTFCDHGITKANIPEKINGITVDEIQNGAFSGEKDLKELTIPGTIKSIGEGVGTGCNSLTSLTIPDSVTNIGRNSFANCTHLKDLTIGDGIEDLNWKVFDNCDLENVHLGSNISFINKWALNSLRFPSNAPGKINLTFDGTKEQWDSINKGKGWDSAIERGKLDITFERELERTMNPEIGDLISQIKEDEDMQKIVLAAAELGVKALDEPLDKNTMDQIFDKAEIGFHGKEKDEQEFAEELVQ